MGMQNARGIVQFESLENRRLFDAAGPFNDDPQGLFASGDATPATTQPSTPATTQPAASDDASDPTQWTLDSATPNPPPSPTTQPTTAPSTGVSSGVGTATMVPGGGIVSAAVSSL